MPARVPAADSSNNRLITEVIGNKSDTSVETVGTTGSLLAYAKGALGQGDVATADASTNVKVSDIVGNKSDAGVQAVTTTASLMAYLKGALDILSGTTGISSWATGAAPANGVSLAEALRYLTDAVAGSTGLATFPSAAAAANSVSIAEVLRYLSEKQAPRLVLKNTGDMSSGYGTGDSPVSIYTVTGDVLITEICAVVNTPIATTSNTGTLALGTANSTAFLIAQTTGDGTEFATAGDVWVDGSPRDDVDVIQRTGAGIVIGGGSDIILTIATNSVTAGDLDFYLRYIPLSSDGAIVAA